jgi:electron transfer flavoprotein beta subunit
VERAYIIDMGDNMVDIIVCIKWVPNTTSVNVDEKTGTLIRAGVPSVINPHDMNALELALKMKDRYGGVIKVITMAPPSARLGLEHAIGMGADKGILITDRVFAGADTLATSYTLAKAIEKIGKFDLIVVGQETIDSSTAHIGAQLASWLKLPYIYYVTEVELLKDSRSLRVKRLLEDAYEVYEVKLPALISVAMHTNYPRRIRLHYKLRAKLENLIDSWDNKVLKLNPNCIGLKGSPTVVSKIEFMPKVHRKKEICKERDPKKAAKWLVERLIEEKLLKI